MKHQWSQSADTWVCDACGLTVSFLPKLVAADADANVLVDLGGVVTGDCPAWQPLDDVALPGILTRITEDLWVNPTQVTGVKDGPPPGHCMTGVTTLAFVGGSYEIVPLPLYEVVALLNGSA